MGFALPNGAHVYLASGYGPAITFTGATNAEHTVITVSAADDIAVGDIVHVNCNWSGIDNVIAKIDAIAENAVTLRNINTTNKTNTRRVAVPALFAKLKNGPNCHKSQRYRNPVVIRTPRRFSSSAMIASAT